MAETKTSSPRDSHLCPPEPSLDGLASLWPLGPWTERRGPLPEATGRCYGAGGPRGLETEEPVSPLPLPLAAQGRPCDDGLLVVEAKAEEGGIT